MGCCGSSDDVDLGHNKRDPNVTKITPANSRRASLASQTSAQAAAAAAGLGLNNNRDGTSRRGSKSKNKLGADGVLAMSESENQPPMNLNGTVCMSPAEGKILYDENGNAIDENGNLLRGTTREAREALKKGIAALKDFEENNSHTSKPRTRLRRKKKQFDENGNEITPSGDGNDDDEYEEVTDDDEENKDDNSNNNTTEEHKDSEELSKRAQTLILKSHDLKDRYDEHLVRKIREDGGQTGVSDDDDENNQNNKDDDNSITDETKSKRKRRDSSIFPEMVIGDHFSPIVRRVGEVLQEATKKDEGDASEHETMTKTKFDEEKAKIENDASLSEEEKKKKLDDLLRRTNSRHLSAEDRKRKFDMASDLIAASIAQFEDLELKLNLGDKKNKKADGNNDDDDTEEKDENGISKKRKNSASSKNDEDDHDDENNNNNNSGKAQSYVEYDEDGNAIVKDHMSPDRSGNQSKNSNASNNQDKNSNSVSSLKKNNASSSGGGVNKNNNNASGSNRSGSVVGTNKNNNSSSITGSKGLTGKNATNTASNNKNGNKNNSSSASNVKFLNEDGQHLDPTSPQARRAAARIGGSTTNAAAGSVTNKKNTGGGATTNKNNNSSSINNSRNGLVGNNNSNRSGSSSPNKITNAANSRFNNNNNSNRSSPLAGKNNKSGSQSPVRLNQLNQNGAAGGKNNNNPYSSLVNGNSDSRRNSKNKFGASSSISPLSQSSRNSRNNANNGKPRIDHGQHALNKDARRQQQNNKNRHNSDDDTDYDYENMESPKNKKDKINSNDDENTIVDENGNVIISSTAAHGGKNATGSSTNKNNDKQSSSSSTTNKSKNKTNSPTNSVIECLNAPSFFELASDQPRASIFKAEEALLNSLIERTNNDNNKNTGEASSSKNGTTSNADNKYKKSSSSSAVAKQKSDQAMGAVAGTIEKFKRFLMKGKKDRDREYENDLDDETEDVFAGSYHHQSSTLGNSRNGTNNNNNNAPSSPGLIGMGSNILRQTKPLSPNALMNQRTNSNNNNDGTSNENENGENDDGTDEESPSKNLLSKYKNRSPSNNSPNPYKESAPESVNELRKIFKKIYKALEEGSSPAKSSIKSEYFLTLMEEAWKALGKCRSEVLNENDKKFKKLKPEEKQFLEEVLDHYEKMLNLLDVLRKKKEDKERNRQERIARGENPDEDDDQDVNGNNNNNTNATDEDIASLQQTQDALQKMEDAMSKINPDDVSKMPGAEKQRLLQEAQNTIEGLIGESLLSSDNSENNAETTKKLAQALRALKSVTKDSADWFDQESKQASERQQLRAAKKRQRQLEDEEDDAAEGIEERRERILAQLEAEKREKKKLAAKKKRVDENGNPIIGGEDGDITGDDDDDEDGLISQQEGHGRRGSKNNNNTNKHSPAYQGRNNKKSPSPAKVIRILRPRSPTTNKLVKTTIQHNKNGANLNPSLIPIESLPTDQRRIVLQSDQALLNAARFRVSGLTHQQKQHTAHALNRCSEVMSMLKDQISHYCAISMPPPKKPAANIGDEKESPNSNKNNRTSFPRNRRPVPALDKVRILLNELLNTEKDNTTEVLGTLSSHHDMAMDEQFAVARAVFEEVQTDLDDQYLFTDKNSDDRGHDINGLMNNYTETLQLLESSFVPVPTHLTPEQRQEFLLGLTKSSHNPHPGSVTAVAIASVEETLKQLKNYVSQNICSTNEYSVQFCDLPVAERTRVIATAKSYIAQTQKKLSSFGPEEQKNVIPVLDAMTNLLRAAASSASAVALKKQQEEKQQLNEMANEEQLQQQQNEAAARNNRRASDSSAAAAALNDPMKRRTSTASDNDPVNHGRRKSLQQGNNNNNNRRKSGPPTAVPKPIPHMVYPDHEHEAAVSSRYVAPVGRIDRFGIGKQSCDLCIEFPSGLARVVVHDSNFTDWQRVKGNALLGQISRAAGDFAAHGGLLQHRTANLYLNGPEFQDPQFAKEQQSEQIKNLDMLRFEKWDWRKAK